MKPVSKLNTHWKVTETISLVDSDNQAILKSGEKYRINTLGKSNRMFEIVFEDRKDEFTCEGIIEGQDIMILRGVFVWRSPGIPKPDHTHDFLATCIPPIKKKGYGHQMVAEVLPLRSHRKLVRPDTNGIPIELLHVTGYWHAEN